MEVFETRKELKVQVNLLNDTFENLLMQQANLQEKEKVMNEISEKLIQWRKILKILMKNQKT